jgi:hypothetical protein
MKEKIQMIKNTEIHIKNSANTVSNPDVESTTSGTTFNYAEIKQPEYSNWQCYMYGGKPESSYNTIYRPTVETLPNRFVRYMMKICLGCTWVKD